MLSELRKLLRRPDTTIVLRGLSKSCGESIWKKSRDEDVVTVSQIKIIIDPLLDGKLHVVLHELLHVYMDVHFGFTECLTYELEETIILGLEKELYDWVYTHNDAMDSWNRAIARKNR